MFPESDLKPKMKSPSFIFHLFSKAGAICAAFRLRLPQQSAASLCFLFGCFFKNFRAESSLRTERLVSLLFRCHHFSTGIHLCACCQATPDTLGMRSECRSCRGMVFPRCFALCVFGFNVVHTHTNTKI